MDRYGEYEQVNGAVCNALMDERDTLQARVRELESCLAHLYECHSYGGEINEDEHKRVMKQALQLITKGPTMNVEQMTPFKRPEPDAMRWAEHFMELNPPIDIGTMHGWFANAMMDMYDHVHGTVARELEDRLRNSIPKPVVEVKVYDLDSSKAQVDINDHNIYGGMWLENAHDSKKWLLKALGMEGGGDE